MIRWLQRDWRGFWFGTVDGPGWFTAGLIFTLPFWLGAILGGCATPQVAEVAPAPSPPVVTGNFCETARKRTWSMKDTPESIAEARAWNRAVDRRCLPPAS